MLLFLLGLFLTGRAKRPARPAVNILSFFFWFCLFVCSVSGQREPVNVRTWGLSIDSQLFFLFTFRCFFFPGRTRFSRMSYLKLFIPDLIYLDLYISSTPIYTHGDGLVVAITTHFYEISTHSLTQRMTCSYAH